MFRLKKGSILPLGSANDIFAILFSVSNFHFRSRWKFKENYRNLVSATAEELLSTGTGAATGLRTVRSNSPDEKDIQGRNCRSTAPRFFGVAVGSLFNISNWSSSG